MTAGDQGWGGLAASVPARGGDASDEDRLACQTARLFASADGRAVLDHLRKMTLDRCLGPDSGDAALRHLEGQRHLVLHLLSLAARGRGDR